MEKIIKTGMVKPRNWK